MKVFKFLLLILKLFLLGIIIIVGAIFLNLIAEILGFYTWYDLFINTEETIYNLGVIDIIFIFIIYPIFLGVLAHYTNRLFKNKPQILK